jgi:mannosyltransferase
MIVHIHFHFHKTGVTKSVENIVPELNKYIYTRVLGYGIDAPKISLFQLLKRIYSVNDTIIHTHRNNEIIFALILRMLGGKFRLFYTRHADGKPSSLTLWLMRKADEVISLNPSMSKALPVRNTLISHGVNTDVFRIGEKNSLQGIPQNKLVSVIGRIRPAKGQMVVMKAMVGPLKNNPDWGLMFVGKTDDEKYVSEIKSLAGKNGLSSRIHFIPESDTILNYYRASTIVAIPSESEGFSLVCLEAMACGLQVIATDSVGIHSEVINNGKNGYLFTKGDHKSLACIITDIISGKSILNPEEIRQTIVDNWSVKHNIIQLLRLYKVTY